MDRTNATRMAVLSVVRTVVVILFLILLKLVLDALPMLQDLDIPNLPFTAQKIIGLLITLLIVAVLVKFGTDIRGQMEMAFWRFPESGQLVAAVVYIVAIIIAYNALSPWLDIALAENAWIYQLLFLILMAIPIVMIGVVLYRNIDTIADLITTRPARPLVEARAASPSGRTCPQCHATNPPEAKFCLQCGAALPEPEPAPPEAVAPSTAVCPNCGAENEPGARFCMECGTQLASAEA